MNKIPKVSIIILNWNGWKDTIECLESVYQINYSNYDIIVVDNGSENESIDKIKEYADGKLEVISRFFNYSRKNKPLRYFEFLPIEAEVNDGKNNEITTLPSWKKLILIRNGKNLGFSGGNNIAIEYAIKVQNPEYILLLNNDTVVDGAFLDELVNIAESDKHIGFVGPKIYNYNGIGDIINFAGGQLIMWQGKAVHIGLNKLDRSQFNTECAVDYIEGSCLLARRHTIETIGLLDPQYFLYWEETDWCMRARNSGYRLLYAPRAKIWHKGGASSNSTPISYYFSRNRFIFTKKYAARKQYTLFLVYFFGYELWLTSIVSLLYHRNFKEWIAFLKGVYEGMKK